VTEPNFELVPSGYGIVDVFEHLDADESLVDEVKKKSGTAFVGTLRALDDVI
jgi:hypothetical protein